MAIAHGTITLAACRVSQNWSALPEGTERSCLKQCPCSLALSSLPSANLLSLTGLADAQSLHHTVAHYTVSGDTAGSAVTNHQDGNNPPNLPRRALGRYAYARAWRETLNQSTSHQRSHMTVSGTKIPLATGWGVAVAQQQVDSKLRVVTKGS